ncbi:hypothetical protein [Streptomyces erythrochromogenes]|uniref:hypothetical protein n=1 Tax=Streptomyces erythrochromogenes TaxID=285574 RepID=UPI0037D205AC
MGNAHYTINRNGQKIEAGYAVEAVCEQDGCEEKIDRGLAYLCGQTPGGDEHGCGGYFCGAHHYMSGDEYVGDLCGECIATYRREHPVDASA